MGNGVGQISRLAEGEKEASFKHKQVTQTICDRVAVGTYGSKFRHYLEAFRTGTTKDSLWSSLDNSGSNGRREIRGKD